MSARRIPRVPLLYAVVDQAAFAPRSVDEVAGELAEAGVEWLQLRAKSLADRDFFLAVETSLRRLEGSAARLWINDRADVAACFGDAVSGLHLGQEDLPPAAARRVLGDATWIGSSTHDLDQARRAAADPAVDLVAIGPVFPTGSKERPDPVVGLDLVRRVRAITAKPLVAIGGIEAGNAPAVLEAGADAVAVIGALARRGAPARSARELLALLAAARS